MLRRLNSQILGASVFGIALVAGAWVLNYLQGAPRLPESALSVATVAAPARAAIPVTDTNGDGVEDWREPLLTAEPVILNTDTATYTRSNTLTERVGIKLMENFLIAKSLGKDVSEVNEEIAKTVLAESADLIKDSPYSNLDITIVPDTSPEVIRTYVNAIASIIQKNDLPDFLHNLRAFELTYLEQNESAANQLVAIAAMYQQNCLDILNLPVPSEVRTEHLNLLNAMCSMSKNLTSMAQATTDPALTLLRLRRYESDEQALAQAFVGFKAMITRQAFVLDQEDSAMMFLEFNSMRNS